MRKYGVEMVLNAESDENIKEFVIMFIETHTHADIDVVQFPLNMSITLFDKWRGFNIWGICARCVHCPVVGITDEADLKNVVSGLLGVKSYQIVYWLLKVG